MGVRERAAAAGTGPLCQRRAGQRQVDAGDLMTGRQQARRFYAAARLPSDERATVTRFLEDMADEISLKNAPWSS